VFLDWTLERVGDILGDLAGLHPCHGVDFLRVGDVGGVGECVGFHIDHLPLGVGVDPVAEDPAGGDEAGFLEGLTGSGVFGAFARFDLADGELPAERAFGYPPAVQEEASVLDDDRCGDSGLI
jgi:hypothetical protein